MDIKGEVPGGVIYPGPPTNPLPPTLGTRQLLVIAPADFFDAFAPITAIGDPKRP
jgi:hypothetical protein